MEPPRTPSAVRPPRVNADYRWTAPKVIAFFEALAAGGSVAEAARAVGMSRQSAYRLRARYAGTEVARGWELAQRAGIAARARRRRPPSRWDGPGVAALARSAHGDAAAGQGDASARQGDTLAGMVTQSGPR